MSMITPVPADARRRRLPFTILMLAGLILFKAVLLFAVVAGASMVETLRPLFGFSAVPGFLETIRDTPGIGTVMVIFGVLLLVSVAGMLSRRRIGWLLAMTITGLFVAIDIYGFMNNGANYLWMGLNILTVFYLNQQDVREVVGAAITLTGAPMDEAAE